MSLHQCVRFNRWEANKVISFIPPDGNFELLKFRYTGQCSVPLYCKPQITIGDHGGRVNVMVGTKNNNGKQVENVVVTAQLPKCVHSATLNPTYGTVTFDDSSKMLRWDIGKLPRDSPLLQGTLTVAPGTTAEAAGSVQCSVAFKVTMFSATGLKVSWSV